LKISGDSASLSMRSPALELTGQLTLVVFIKSAVNLLACIFWKIGGHTFPALGDLKLRAEKTIYPSPSMTSTVKSAGCKLSNAGSMSALAEEKTKGPDGDVDVATTYPGFPALAQRM
jgi:hypothetical protein